MYDPSYVAVNSVSFFIYQFSLKTYTHLIRLLGASTVHAETERTLHSNQLTDKYGIE